jgi:5-methylcytosine-specific restriction protein A
MAYLAAHPMCEDCLAKGIYEVATEVHHDIPHHGDRQIFNNSKLRALSKACHSKRTIKEIVREGGQ